MFSVTQISFRETIWHLSFSNSSVCHISKVFDSIVVPLAKCLTHIKYNFFFLYHFLFNVCLDCFGEYIKGSEEGKCQRKSWTGGEKVTRYVMNCSSILQFGNILDFIKQLAMCWQYLCIEVCIENTKKDWNSREKHEDDQYKKGGGQHNLGAEKREDFSFDCNYLYICLSVYNVLYTVHAHPTPRIALFVGSSVRPQKVPHHIYIPLPRFMHHQDHGTES